MAGRPGELAFNCPRISERDRRHRPLPPDPRADQRPRDHAALRARSAGATCRAASTPTWCSPRRWSACASRGASAASTTSPSTTCSARASSTMRSAGTTTRSTSTATRRTTKPSLDEAAAGRVPRGAVPLPRAARRRQSAGRGALPLGVVRGAELGADPAELPGDGCRRRRWRRAVARAGHHAPRRSTGSRCAPRCAPVGPASERPGDP